MSHLSRPVERTLPPDKIDDHHLDRLAIVYIRQSTLQQIEHHRESTRLQYGLAARACQLGWPRPRVLVIDEDLGRSGTSVDGRPGFQRLVAEVGLGHVGLVLGFEVSRLARSCRDWYHLLEICALAGTLIADSDGIYDPALYNDRLLLGLKGTMSEAELHIMRARLDEGRRHKAERGELGFNLPRGYLRRPSGEVALDPDERVRDTIALIFDVFARRRSVHGVVRYLNEHGISLPDRERGGLAKGELRWSAPHRAAVANILANPIYAGAYAYGRQRAGRRVGGCQRRGLRPREADGCDVLIKERLPAFISWEVYEENQEQLAANRSKHKGVPRGGPSLLAGLLVCGRCGYRMATCYRSNGHALRYACTRAQVNRGEAPCQSMSGAVLDASVTELVLAVLQPSAIEVALQLAEDLELDRARRRRQWAQRLETARYEAERAQRQYDRAEPENRLVVRTLERRWEEALATQTRLEEEYARWTAAEPARLSVAEQDEIRRLAADVPALWRSPTTTAAERKEIARLLIERVVVTIEGASEKLSFDCHWAGGACTHHEIERPVRYLAQLSSYGTLVTRAQELLEAGETVASVTRQLNAEGWRRAHGGPFTESGVWSMLRRLGTLPQARGRPSLLAPRAEGEHTVAELSARLHIPDMTLYSWIYKKWLPARKVVAAHHALWLVRLDDVLALQAQRKAEGRRRMPYQPATPASRA